VKSPKHDQPQHLLPFSQAFFRLDGIFVGFFPLIQASTSPLQKKTPWEINTCVDWQSLESAMSSPLGGFVVWTWDFFPKWLFKIIETGKMMIHQHLFGYNGQIQMDIMGSWFP
jgi:hypothetical protein